MQDDVSVIQQSLDTLHACSKAMIAHDPPLLIVGSGIMHACRMISVRSAQSGHGAYLQRGKACVCLNLADRGFCCHACLQDDVRVIQQGLDTLHAYLHACSKAKFAGLQQLQLIVQQLEQNVRQNTQQDEQQTQQLEQDVLLNMQDVQQAEQQQEVRQYMQEMQQQQKQVEQQQQQQLAGLPEDSMLMYEGSEAGQGQQQQQQHAAGAAAGSMQQSSEVSTVSSLLHGLPTAIVAAFPARKQETPAWCAANSSRITAQNLLLLPDDYRSALHFLRRP
jgi:hypothetical protein